MNEWMKERGFSLLIAIVVTLVSSTAWSLTWDESMKVANTAYNKSDYEQAIRSYVAAIQTDPVRAAAYRNLARSYFWLDRYSEATVYYDHYLRLADPQAADIKQVTAERKLSASRTSDKVWTLPEDQKLALGVLKKELDAGRAYTPGGGGAWGLYETLIRTGYAEPNLAQIRSLLARQLLNEFEAGLIPASTDLVPRVSLEDWQLQAERLDAARKVSSEPAFSEILDRRSSIVETAIALLASQPVDAARLASVARIKNPDLRFVAWYEIVALTDAEQYEDALEAVSTYSRQAIDSRPADVPYIQVARAMILQRMGRSEDASEAFLDSLKK